MGGKMILMILVAAAAAAIGFQGSDAATYSVGNGAWSIPTSNSAYSDWAKNIMFVVGDVLTFNFVTGAHTVAEVNKKDYDSCTVASPILLDNNGPANITLKSTGTHYFVCTIHCAQGQKLTVNVTSAASTSSPPPKSTPTPGSTPSSPPPPTGSSPSPSSSSSTPPPPPPSGATSVSIFSGLVFLPIFLAALL